MSGQTRRQQIAARLEQGPATVRGLAAELQLQIKTVVEELEHVRRSLRGRKLIIEPARCLGCGRVFRKRERFTAPSRCPGCRSENTRSPEFWIE
jgi:predicted Zn-ribbon and HTH transcriptional regulator